jgi:hypothetical protein
LSTHTKFTIMYFINLNIDSKPISYRKQVLNNITEDVKNTIIWFCDLIDVELIDLQIEEEDLMSTDGLISVYTIKYSLKDKKDGAICNYKTFIPRFIGNYIIVNGQRYVFIYSIADKFLDRFGTESMDAKLSNLYRKVVFKNILDETKPILYESKHKTLPVLNFLILYLLKNDESLMESNLSLLDLLYMVLQQTGFQVDMQELDNNQSNIVTTVTKGKKVKYITIQETETSIVYTDTSVNKQLIVDVTYESNYRRRFVKSFKDYGGSRLLERLMGKHSFEIMTLLYGEISAIFDPLVRQEFKDPYYFLFTLVPSNDFYNYIKNCGLYSSLKSKTVRFKTFLLHPLVRQLMHLVYERIRTRKLPRKHSTSLSILYKIMQVEYVEDKIHNPISEVMLQLKATYAHKFAMKRLSHKIRLVTDMLGYLDPIVTPESKKVGSVNYLVWQFENNID